MRAEAAAGLTRTVVRTTAAVTAPIGTGDAPDLPSGSDEPADAPPGAVPATTLDNKHRSHRQ